MHRIFFLKEHQTYVAQGRTSNQDSWETIASDESISGTTSNVGSE